MSTNYPHEFFPIPNYIYAACNNNGTRPLTRAPGQLIAGLGSARDGIQFIL